MVVPGLYGYVSATKWVTSLRVTTFAEQGYWTPPGLVAAGAPIKPEAADSLPQVDRRSGRGCRRRSRLGPAHGDIGCRGAGRPGRLAAGRAGGDNWL